MAPATASPPALSDQQIVEMLSLARESDTVELKLTVPEDHHRSAVVALGMDPLDAQVRLVYFFDTPDLTLDRHGVVVRARRVQNRGDDTVVKLRPVVPAELPVELRESPAFGVEVDAMPGKYVCSGSLKSRPKSASIKDVLDSGRSIRKLFSKEQRSFFADHAPAGVELDDLTVLGPLFVLKLKFSPVGYDRKLVTELWLFPDGSRILELSTKCGTSEAFQVAAETRAYFSACGISLSGRQETKTRKALKYFADRASA